MGCVLIIVILLVIGLLAGLITFAQQNPATFFAITLFTIYLAVYAFKVRGDFKKIGGDKLSQGTDCLPHPLSIDNSIFDVENARSATERRLLLAREFSRLSETVLKSDPMEHSTWPNNTELDNLRTEIEVLLASAKDRDVTFLSEVSINTGPSQKELVDAIESLRMCIQIQGDLQSSFTFNPEKIRILTRERNHVRTAHDKLIRSMQ